MIQLTALLQKDVEIENTYLNTNIEFISCWNYHGTLYVVDTDETANTIP